MRISRSLIAMLSITDLGLQDNVEFVKVDCKVPGAIRGKITFRMDSNIWMVTFIGKERRDASSRARSVVESEFSKGE